MSNKMPVGTTDGEILQAVGLRLARLRKSRGLSQTAAARLSGLSRRTVYAAEHGENPRMLTLIRLLRTYGSLEALDEFIPTSDISPIAIIDRLRRDVGA